MPHASLKTHSSITLALLRVAMGWVMLYAGMSKLLDPDWSAAGYLTNASTFPEFFAWFAQPGILPITNFLNTWGLLAIGISLILGVFVRASAFFGIVLMILYYLPTLDFPYPNSHSLLVDSHIIYALVFLVFIAIRAGRHYGLDAYLMHSRWFKKRPRLKHLLG